MAVIPNPRAAVLSKSYAGISDMGVKRHPNAPSGSKGVFRFMGATVASINMTQQYNGSSSSVEVTLVEDPDMSDSFIQPTVPSVYAVSLPSGGVGAPILLTEAQATANLQPNGFIPSNTPFYFCGFVSSWEVPEVSQTIKQISVRLQDPSELLQGVQCLLGGFALSQNLGVGSPRFDKTDNIIDVFGYFDHGLDSELNEFGMPWNNIKTAIEAIGITNHGVNMEFVFVGDAFNNVPDWYRVKGDVVNFISLINIVAQDGGSDVAYIARKVDASTMLVEIRGIRRTNYDVITQGEIDAFLAARTDIVFSATKGLEFRNEPTSKVIVGGKRNSNYVAWPSKDFGGTDNLRANGIESWPASISERMFGDADPDIDPGSVFPFWGFAPDGQTPLTEPVLSLDHVSFFYDDFENRLPSILIESVDKTIKTRVHTDVFITDDGAEDDRPFAEVTDIIEWQAGQTTSKPAGYIKGLPLNEEIVRSAMVSQEIFELVYRAYYPNIANALEFLAFNTSGLLTAVTDYSAKAGGLTNGTLKAFLTKGNGYIMDWFDEPYNIVNGISSLTDSESDTLRQFKNQLREWVQEYAENHIGKQWLVCLPNSIIMDRVLDPADPAVPTRKERPEIEYSVVERGYWEVLPAEFDGIEDEDNQGQEKQIRDKFMAEDGRFFPMIILQGKPSGLANFHSNGSNRIMLNDLESSSYRPNKIAEQDFERVYVGCSIDQLIKRPDLAVVTMNSGPVRFDPEDEYDDMKGYVREDIAEFSAAVAANESRVRRGPIVKMFWRMLTKDANLRKATNPSLTDVPASNAGLGQVRSDIFNRWADDIVLDSFIGDGRLTEWMPEEVLMDVEAIIIPLESNWVSYGPWYKNTDDFSSESVDVEIDGSLVPWNFARPSGGNWDDNLNAAGVERLARSLSLLDYIEQASISVAGFPEFGPAQNFGFNGNLTSIAARFGADGVTTVYNFSTYDRKPGTFRKSEFDAIENSRIEFKPELPETVNLNVRHTVTPPYARFKNPFRR